MHYSHKQYVELFHLLFLGQLSKKLDKKLYAVKGGCNLRFFFKSIRYSEDMDLDITIIQKETLRQKVNKILTSDALVKILQSYQMTIDHLSEPKQTDTVQRWKLSLKTPGVKISLPTKIEFSRREMGKDVIFEGINSEFVAAYQLTPILANHYSAAEMWVQKIQALSFRSQTQARDVFDLYLLLNLINPLTIKHSLDKSVLEQAKVNLFSLSFSDFKSQVVAYLTPEYQQQYDDPDLWKIIVSRICHMLERSNDALN